MKLLVKYSDNWSDEMDIEGFKIMTVEAWDAYCNKARAATYPRDWYIGSNEIMEAYSYKAFMNSFTSRPITELEAQVINTLIGDDYGAFPSSDQVFRDWDAEDDTDA